jgi:hypothetical protein
MDIDWSLYLSDNTFAANELGRMLNAGELALFVGAGISLDHGAPSWHGLARLMAKRTGVESAGINRKAASGAELAKVFNKISRNTEDFKKLVKDCLYYRWSPKTGNWGSDTLVALGALMSGNYRGRIETVLSLNFDSILEMYLRLYGSIPQSITSFPHLSKRADVHIFHSHGYLPYDEAEHGSTDILLSEQTYLEAIGDTADFRRKMMEFVFGQKRFLAIGLSGDDIYSSAVLAHLAKQNAHEGLMGCWIVGPRVSDDKIADLKAMKIAAVRLASYKALPEFLFKVARRAAFLMEN